MINPLIVVSMFVLGCMGLAIALIFVIRVITPDPPLVPHVLHPKKKRLRRDEVETMMYKNAVDYQNNISIERVLVSSVVRGFLKPIDADIVLGKIDEYVADANIRNHVNNRLSMHQNGLVRIN